MKFYNLVTIFALIMLFTLAVLLFPDLFLQLILTFVKTTLKLKEIITESIVFQMIIESLNKFKVNIEIQPLNEAIEKYITNMNRRSVYLFDLDLEQMWKRYETYNAITKTACILIFNSSFIAVCLNTVVLNLYGDYLLDRFKLEQRYPRLAVFIKYRKKLGKYYIISNIVFIFITCSVNIIYGLCILDIIYTS